MTTGVEDSSDVRRDRWRSRRTAQDALRLWPWVPVGLAAVYGAILLFTLRSVVAAIYVDADIASAPVLGELIGRAPPGAKVVLGNIPWYTALWFEELTRGFPVHRAIWELTPWVLSLIGIGLVGWATSRLVGRWAGWIVAATCVCAGATLLPLQFAWSVHAVSYVHICVLGASIVPLALAPGWIGGRLWRHVAFLVLVALVTGLGVAADKLVIIGGLVPFLTAGGVLAYISARRDSLRVLGSVLGVLIGSEVVAMLATHVARGQQIVPHPFPITFSAFNQLLYHIGDLVASLAYIANGNFGGASLSLTSAVAFVCAAVVLIAVYAVLRHGRRTVLDLGTRGSGERPGQTHRATARMAFLVFWLACVSAVSIAFVASSVPVGIGTIRYVVPVAYGLVVIVTLAVVGQPVLWRQGLLVAGTSAVIAGSILALVQRQIQVAYQPAGAVANGLLRVARSEGLTVGYSGYWDAAPLTWELRARLQVYPVIACGPALCQFPFHKMSSWYTPHPVSRSFLVIDSALAGPNSLNAPPPALGKPIRQVAVGQLLIYVYPYDIASKIVG